MYIFHISISLLCLLSVTAVGCAGCDFMDDWGRETKGIQCLAESVWKLCIILAGLQITVMWAHARIRHGISVLKICKVF